MALVSGKIYERFKDIVHAFRYFDTDHQLSLTLNEFAQGIEYLRIKMSFEDVKRLFMYLDVNFNKEINLNEFKLLSEENWRKIDPVARYIKSIKIRQAPPKKESPKNAYGTLEEPMIRSNCGSVADLTSMRRSGSLR